MSSESKVTIKIPRNLYRRLKLIIEGSGFDSVTDFIVYILRDIAAGVEADHGSDTDDDIHLTAEEIKKVRQRLKNLGYF